MFWHNWEPQCPLSPTGELSPSWRAVCRCDWWTACWLDVISLPPHSLPHWDVIHRLALIAGLPVTLRTNTHILPSPTHKYVFSDETVLICGIQNPVEKLNAKCLSLSAQSVCVFLLKSLKISLILSFLVFNMYDSLSLITQVLFFPVHFFCARHFLHLVAEFASAG